MKGRVANCLSISYFSLQDVLKCCAQALREQRLEEERLAAARQQEFVHREATAQIEQAPIPPTGPPSLPPPPPASRFLTEIGRRRCK